MYVKKEEAAVRHKITSAKADSLRERAMDAVRKDTKSLLELAEVLWETWAYDVKVGGVDTPLWIAWGHESWEQYVEVELGIHMTTASKFRRMHQVYGIDYVDAIDSKDMDGLSVTKLSILTRVVNKTNINVWFRKAKKRSCCALEEDVMRALHGGVQIGAVHTLAVPCTKKEQKRMRDIIHQAQERMKIKRPGAALLAILEEWNTIVDRGLKGRKKSKAA